MPIIRIKDNETGKTIKVNWQEKEMPTDGDIANIFEEARSLSKDNESFSKPPVKADIFSAWESAKRGLKNVFKTIAGREQQEFIQTVKEKEDTIRKFRSDLADILAKPIEENLPTYRLEPSKTPISAATSILGEIGKTVIGQPQSVSRVGQTLTKLGVESAIPTPSELALASIPLGALASKAPIGKLSRVLEKTTASKTTEKLSNADIVINAIKEAKPIRKEQDLLYSQERTQRLKDFQMAGEGLSGEARAKVKMAKLGGELKKVKYESIIKKIGKNAKERQGVVNGIFEELINSPKLVGFEQATGINALRDILNPKGGRVPTESGLAALEKVFGKDFSKTLLEKRTTFEKMQDAGYEIANIPRAIMASFDVSAPLRQGIFFVSKPKQFLPAFSKMFKAFASEDSYNAITEQIAKSPNLALMKESGLALTEMKNLIGLREERFASSWAEKMPGNNVFSKLWNDTVGRGVRASGRAYAGFLNKLRADTFDDFVARAQRVGVDPYKDPKLAKDIASLVNRGTGRGTLPEFLGDAKLVNSVLFSPKLIASRIQLLNPWYYISPNISPFVRKEALKTMLASSSIVASTIGLAVLAGAKTELDPRSADFGKIKVGNTRIDLGGGFSQYIRLGAQLISGKMKSTTTGRMIELGKKYGDPTRKDVAIRFIENKEAPVISFATAMLNGKNMVGEPFNAPKEIADRFIPMVVQDIVDVSKDDPRLLPVSLLAALGAGVQTYESKPKKIK